MTQHTETWTPYDEALSLAMVPEHRTRLAGMQSGYRVARAEAAPLVEALVTITDAIFTDKKAPTTFIEAILTLLAIRAIYRLLLNCYKFAFRRTVKFS